MTPGSPPPSPMTARDRPVTERRSAVGRGGEAGPDTGTAGAGNSVSARAGRGVGARTAPGETNGSD